MAPKDLCTQASTADGLGAKPLRIGPRRGPVRLRVRWAPTIPLILLPVLRTPTLGSLGTNTVARICIRQAMQAARGTVQAFIHFSTSRARRSTTLRDQIRVGSTWLRITPAMDLDTGSLRGLPCLPQRMGVGQSGNRSIRQLRKTSYGPAV